MREDDESVPGFHEALREVVDVLLDAAGVGKEEVRHHEDRALRRVRMRAKGRRTRTLRRRTRHGRSGSGTRGGENKKSEIRNRFLCKSVPELTDGVVWYYILYVNWLA